MKKIAFLLISALVINLFAYSQNIPKQSEWYDGAEIKPKLVEISFRLDEYKGRMGIYLDMKITGIPREKVSHVDCHCIEVTSQSDLSKGKYTILKSHYGENYEIGSYQMALMGWQLKEKGDTVLFNHEPRVTVNENDVDDVIGVVVKKMSIVTTDANYYRFHDNEETPLFFKINQKEHPNIVALYDSVVSNRLKEWHEEKARRKRQEQELAEQRRKQEMAAQQRREELARQQRSSRQNNDINDISWLYGSWYLNTGGFHFNVVIKKDKLIFREIVNGIPRTVFEGNYTLYMDRIEMRGDVILRVSLKNKRIYSLKGEAFRKN